MLPYCEDTSILPKITQEEALKEYLIAEEKNRKEWEEFAKIFKDVPTN